MDSLQKTQAAPASPDQRFQLLPEAIRDWLTSEQVLNSIIEINSKNGFVWPKISVIPKEITLLVTGFRKPQEFSNSLQASLGLNPQQSKLIAAQIKTKILEKISSALKNTQNIDLSPIQGLVKQSPESPTVNAGGTHSLSAMAQKASQAKQQTQQHESEEVRQMPAQSPQLKKAVHPVDSTQSTAINKSEEKVLSASKPFMLHEENSPNPSQGEEKEVADFKFEIPSKAPDSEAPKTKAGFGSFFSGLVSKDKNQNNQAVESKHETPKVVHYSAFRTVLGEQDKKNSKQ